MEIVKLLIDKHSNLLYTRAKLISVGSWYFWKPGSYPEDMGSITIDLAPYARNRGRHIHFDLIPFEDWHLETL